MIDYLKKYNLTDNDLNAIKKRYNDTYVNNFEIMMDNVNEILSFLKEYGVKNLVNVVLYRPDICFRDVDYFRNQLDKFDKNFILYVFDHDIEDLINFDI
jgi:hypothetical protein